MREKTTFYFLRALLLEALPEDDLPDFFLVPPPDLATVLPLRPSLASFPASMSCS